MQNQECDQQSKTKKLEKNFKKGLNILNNLKKLKISKYNLFKSILPFVTIASSIIVSVKVSSLEKAEIPKVVAKANVVKAPKEVQVLKIGFSGQLTGSETSFGKGALNGLKLAVEDLNNENMVVNNKTIKFEIIEDDDGGDPKQARVIAQKFCDLKMRNPQNKQKLVGILGHINSGTALPASEIYSKCGLPNITPSATNPKITEQGFKTTFRLISNDNVDGKKLAEFSKSYLKATTAVVIDDRTAYGQGFAKVFMEKASALGIKVLSNLHIDSKTSDFSSVLTSVKEKNPDMIFFAGLKNQAGPMLRQMENLRINNKFVSGGGICNPDLVKLAGNAKTLNNVYCALAVVDYDKNKKNKAWLKKVQERFPNQDMTFTSYSYDATFAFAQAIKKAQVVDPDFFLKELKRIEFTGISGLVSFDANGDLKNPEFSYFTFNDNNRVAIKNYKEVKSN